MIFSSYFKHFLEQTCTTQNNKRPKHANIIFCWPLVDFKKAMKSDDVNCYDDKKSLQNTFQNNLILIRNITQFVNNQLMF